MGVVDIKFAIEDKPVLLAALRQELQSREQGLRQYRAGQPDGNWTEEQFEIPRLKRLISFFSEVK